MADLDQAYTCLWAVLFLDTRRSANGRKGPDSVEKVWLIGVFRSDSVFHVRWMAGYDDGTETDCARRAVLRVLD